MTPDEFKAARKTLGLTAQQMGEMLGLSRSTVFRIAAGEWTCTPGTERLLRAYLDGYRPNDWPEDKA